MAREAFAYTRRSVMQMAAGGVSAAVLVGLTGGCEALFEQIKNRPVRRDIDTLSPSDPIIQTFRDGVDKMKKLATSDPRNWIAQADIHKNWCPHGNWYFLPWHRAYLFYFEKIIQKLTGNKDFGLPYWNWQANPKVPQAFWGGASNPLFHTPRAATPTSSAPASAVGPSVIENILSIPETDFFLFASQKSTTQRGFSAFGELEGTPHNTVHGFVGGDMGYVPTAARDPVFWAHHCMVDCIWAEWNIGRKQRNTSDSAWLNFTFSGNFVDADGASVDITVAATILMPLLAYRYEITQKGTQPTAEEIDARAIADLRRFIQAGIPSLTVPPKPFLRFDQVELALGEPGAVLAVPAAPLREVISSHTDNRIVLSLGGMRMPEVGNFFVRVFLGNVEASPHTPIDDPHYAGSFAFFTGEQKEMTAAFLVDVTHTLRRLAKAGELNGDETTLPLRLVPVPMHEKERMLALRSAATVVATSVGFSVVPGQRADLPGRE